MADAFCPNCGLDLAHDTIIERDGFIIDPRGVVLYHDRLVRLSPYQVAILYTVAAANGRPVKRETIAERLGYEGDDPSGLLSVQMTHIRERLREIPFPLRTIHGAGICWGVPEA